MEFNVNFYSLKIREFYSAFLNQEIVIVVVVTTEIGNHGESVFCAG